MNRTQLFTVLFCAVSTPAASSQQLVQDDFNRPNSTNLGPDWVEANNDIEIFNQKARGKNSFQNDTWMYHATFAELHATSKARVKFGSTPGDTFFGVSVVIGLEHTTWSGTAVRVTDNDLDGKFDRIFFNAAVNAGAWYSQPTPVLYDFPAPLEGGQLTVWAEPADDMVVARVEDLSGNLVGIYTASGIAGTPFPPTGTDVGIWISSKGTADNFFAIEHRDLDAYPTSVSISAGGEQTLDISLGSVHAGDFYILLGSLSGTAPGTAAGGGVTVPLNLDAFLLWTLTHPGVAPYSGSLGFLDSVGHARARFSLPAGSSTSLVGLNLDHAAVALDLGTLVPTAATNSGALSLVP